MILRVIDDPELDGAWNMAVDQALLACAEEIGQVTLRFYRWTPATLSLGYFQRAEDRRLHPRGLACPVVRRVSGGGAILHDRELTYSLCVPGLQRWSGQNEMLYNLVHSTIVEFLDSVQIASEIHTGSTGKSRNRVNAHTPFLCFERRFRGDIIMGGYKIMGSAQRRLKKSVLQHGSFLLEKSTYAAHLLGVFDLTRHRFSYSQIVDYVAHQISNSLNLQAVPGTLSEPEQAIARTIMARQFGNELWTFRR
jgi:lipoate-protein ligase A